MAAKWLTMISSSNIWIHYAMIVGGHVTKSIVLSPDTCELGDLASAPMIFSRKRNFSPLNNGTNEMVHLQMNWESQESSTFK